ncbi:Stk1 family PASTA domain-containing Ser/Thr kinase [Demequina sp.]|uniref:Stk1 family PASTA domain-containing Ser/Thr kinase n=1 Tax=Demequina sp. TaxID=2050685 RepID=UPI003D15269D
MSDEAKILAGRYEVGDLIGRGGMAEVHIGYDTRLGRTVAVKILRADLARDPSFQTRFRREAQSAAGLNHPSIVAVYDTGEDTIVGSTGAPQAVPFIVMEYVEGHTVRDILKGDVAAPIDEAVEIVSGVLSALEYSHHAGLVHRDIKPGNVMLTPTGAVKVMDFGIARALADAGQTMTQTQAVVGTAQYLSPEQARGENVDARSDLYSTGCLLFELLTGRPPFIGDSPVSVAYQHVREAAPRPSQYASDVPQELDQIVLRALAKDRNERYSSAGEFLADLRAFSSGDPVDPSTGAIGVAGAAGLGAAAGAAAGLGAAALMDDDRTAIADRATQAMPAVPTTGATEVLPAQSPWATVTAPAPAEIVADPLDPTLYDDEDEERKRKRRQYLLLGAAALAALLIVLAIFLFTRGSGEPNVSASAGPIPSLVNATQEEARAQLEELGLKPVFEGEPSNDVEVDLVTRTAPPEGEMVPSGSTITVYFSTGPAELEVPDVAELPQTEAITLLTENGLTVSEVLPDNEHPEIAKGLATVTDPAAGTPVASGSPVILYIASGQVDLPDVTGMTEDEARSTLGDLGLKITTKRVETGGEPAGTVYKQSPKPGLVEVGSTVTITVAEEPTTAEVPGVVGKSQSDAESTLTSAGFKVTVKTGTSEDQPAGNVYAQSPDAGISLKLGQPVTIFVSTGPPEPDPTATP